LLRGWIEQWLALKIDVSPTTHLEYARLLRHRVVRDLGDLRVGDITRDEHMDLATFASWEPDVRDFRRHLCRHRVPQCS
jgi:hypothetical protein